MLLIVLLRISIGWQMLYEGLWKIDSLTSAKPWTSEGYLKNSQGPFRDHFRNMTGDPNDYRWLNYDAVAKSWNGWHKRYLSHYTDLSDSQKAKLYELLNGKKLFAANLNKLPAGVLQEDGTLAKVSKRVITYNAKQKRLEVDGIMHLVPKERERLYAAVPAEDFPEFHKAVKDVFARSARLSFKEQLAASLKGNPERVGIILEAQKGTIDYKRIGEIELYKAQVARYEKNLAAAQQDYQFDHLQKQWAELQQMRGKLIAPVKALDADLKEAGRKLLTPAQLSQGPVPAEKTQLRQLNLLTIVGLTGLGILLIVGLGTRFAAIGAAMMIGSFYLVMPPWPGVPAAPGPEHSLFVNKNFIEVIALLCLAALPSGSWFGLDGLLGRLFKKKA